MHHKAPVCAAIKTPTGQPALNVALEGIDQIAVIEPDGVTNCRPTYSLLDFLYPRHDETQRYFIPFVHLLLSIHRFQTMCRLNFPAARTLSHYSKTSPYP